MVIAFSTNGERACSIHDSGTVGVQVFQIDPPATAASFVFDRPDEGTMTCLPEACGGTEQSFQSTGPDGAVRWINDRAFPVREADGQVRRVVGIAKDITQSRLFSPKDSTATA